MHVLVYTDCVHTNHIIMQINWVQFDHNVVYSFCVCACIVYVCMPPNNHQKLTSSLNRHLSILYILIIKHNIKVVRITLTVLCKHGKVNL